MSDVKKCDRCGAYYTPDTKARTVFEYFGETSKRTRNCGDMCPRCAERFDRWWNKKRRDA